MFFTNKLWAASCVNDVAKSERKMRRNFGVMCPRRYRLFDLISDFIDARLHFASE